MTADQWQFFGIVVTAITTVTVALIGSKRYVNKKTDEISGEMVEGFKAERDGMTVFSDNYRKFVEDMRQEQDARDRKYQLDRKIWQETENELRLKVDQLDDRISKLLMERDEMLAEIRKLKATLQVTKTKLEALESRIKNSSNNVG